jgi:hypothetical protein
MDKNDVTIDGCIGIGVLLVVAMIGGTLMNGWAISVLWGWFVSPFFKLPLLTVPYAIGLGLVMSLLVNQSVSETKNKSWLEIISAMLSRIVFVPLFSVFMGWIIRLFIK